jgi:hypothetical protein
VFNKCFNFIHLTHRTACPYEISIKKPTSSGELLYSSFPVHNTFLANNWVASGGAAVCCRLKKGAKVVGWMSETLFHGMTQRS